MGCSVSGPEGGRDTFRGRGGFPVRIGEILPGVLERVGPKGLWAEARLRRAWTEAVGPQLAERTRVGRLRGTVLEVWVPDETWATELRYLGSVVTDRLNGVLGPGTVTEIVARRRHRRRA